jgi:beta-glucuronidase
MLRPVETPTREIKKLDGLWAFSLDRENCGIDQRWWESALQESRAIAVPGSFNDQFADADIRNYAGNVWYQREVLYRKVGQASVSCCVSMRSLITASVGQ